MGFSLSHYLSLSLSLSLSLPISPPLSLFISSLSACSSLSLSTLSSTPPHVLCSADGFGVEVALRVHRGGLLQAGAAEGGVHVVWRQSPRDGTEAGHCHLKQVLVILL